MIRDLKHARVILLFVCALLIADAILCLHVLPVVTWPEYPMLLGIAFFPIVLIQPMWQGDEWAVLLLGLIFLMQLYFYQVLHGIFRQLV